MMIDRRIRHFTTNNVSRLLDRKRIEHGFVPTNEKGARMLVVLTGTTPAQRYFLRCLAFSYSAKYGFWFRAWKRGEA